MSSPKIVVLSGSGVSAESGLPTFRDSGGLWREYTWEELATPRGWARQPEVVLEFYNERRAKAWAARPNAAHRAIAELESQFEVVVVTQNVDDLHERAGSSQVLHVHGELAYARGQSAQPKRYRIDGDPIRLGQLCEEGTQLRPDVVWFGEAVRHFDEAREHIRRADRVLVVGTSLSVYPAAMLTGFCRPEAEKVLVAFEVEQVPRGYTFLQGKATEMVPQVVERWLRTGASGGPESEPTSRSSDRVL